MFEARPFSWGDQTKEGDCANRAQKTGRYCYSLEITKRTKEIESADPPRVFLKNLADFTELCGLDWDKLPLVVSARRDGEVAWARIHGTLETAQLTLFPMLAEDEKITLLSTEEYHDIGLKALNAYKVIRDNWIRIQSSGRIRKADKDVQTVLDGLREKMQIIENAVTDIEDMAKLLELKYVRNEPIKICATKLHTAERTVSRKVSEMAVHIGRVLHMSLTPAELQVLLDLAERKRLS